MQKVEQSLVDIGRRSDSRLLDKMAANYARMEKHTKAQGLLRSIYVGEHD